MSRLLFAGPLWEGSTAQHRCEAFQQIPGLTTLPLDSFERVSRASFVDRVRHKLRLPADRSNLNGRLWAEAVRQTPELVFVDSTRVLFPATVRALREQLGCTVGFYSPDDVGQRHNSSRQLEACARHWDVFFTTKSFNVPELAARGVTNPFLVGNAFSPRIHRPLTREEVGADFERFDVVFAGAYERERTNSINALAEAGFSAVIYGNGFARRRLHSSIELRPAQFGLDYARAVHTGKVALCFLRRLNRDQVTTRSVELPAMGRPMVGQKTVEHDCLFIDGTEYVAFSDDDELCASVNMLLRDHDRRIAISNAGRARCWEGGYSVDNRARVMLHALLTAHSGHSGTAGAPLYSRGPSPARR